MLDKVVAAALILTAMFASKAVDAAERIKEGESAEIVILPRAVLDQVLADGNIVPGTIIDIAQSSIGIGVSQGRAQAGH